MNHLQLWFCTQIHISTPINMFVFVSGVIRTLATLDVESKPHYWLTIFAQDHGVVPLFSSVEVSSIITSIIIYLPYDMTPWRYFNNQYRRFFDSYDTFLVKDDLPSVLKVYPASGYWLGLVCVLILNIPCRVQFDILWSVALNNEFFIRRT